LDQNRLGSAKRAGAALIRRDRTFDSEDRLAELT
jgi:hypothetical protein